MSNFKERLTIEDHKNDFDYKKSNTGLNIQFNRVAFIFFVVFLINAVVKTKIIIVNTSNNFFKVYLQTFQFLKNF